MASALEGAATASTEIVRTRAETHRQMKYWVNEAKATNLAMVCEDACPHGVNLATQRENGSWQRPFDKKEECVSTIKATGHNYNECKKHFASPKQSTEAA